MLLRAGFSTLCCRLCVAETAAWSSACGRVLPLRLSHIVHRSHLKLFSQVHIMQPQVRLPSCSLSPEPLWGSSGWCRSPCQQVLIQYRHQSGPS